MPPPPPAPGEVRLAGWVSGWVFCQLVLATAAKESPPHRVVKQWPGTKVPQVLHVKCDMSLCIMWTQLRHGPGYWHGGGGGNGTVRC